MYQSKIIEKLVSVAGSEEEAKKIMHYLGFMWKRTDNLSELVPNSMETQSINCYLLNRRLHAKCHYFSNQLIKYDKLCLSLGIDAEFRNQKFKYDENTGKEITVGKMDDDNRKSALY
jgi:hypothetical protein